jgi:hypothetical protein
MKYFEEARLLYVEDKLVCLDTHQADSAKGTKASLEVVRRALTKWQRIPGAFPPVVFYTSIDDVPKRLKRTVTQVLAESAQPSPVSCEDVTKRKSKQSHTAHKRPNPPKPHTTTTAATSHQSGLVNVKLKEIQKKVVAMESKMNAERKKQAERIDSIMKHQKKHQKKQVPFSPNLIPIPIPIPIPDSSRKVISIEQTKMEYKMKILEDDNQKKMELAELNHKLQMQQTE